MNVRLTRMKSVYSGILLSGERSLDYMMYRRRKVSVDQVSSTFNCVWASHSPCLCQLLAVATESKPRHFRDSMDISELSAATVGGNYQSKFCNNTTFSPFGTKNVAFMGSS